MKTQHSQVIRALSLQVALSLCLGFGSSGFAATLTQEEFEIASVSIDETDGVRLPAVTLKTKKADYTESLHRELTQGSIQEENGKFILSIDEVQTRQEAMDEYSFMLAPEGNTSSDIVQLSGPMYFPEYGTYEILFEGKLIGTVLYSESEIKIIN